MLSPLRSDLRKTLLTWAILLTGILFFTGSKVIFASQPFERDEGEYAYSGAVILSGGTPYLDTYNMKLPGTYYMYALVSYAFGDGEVPIRLATMFFGLVSAFFLHRIIWLYLDQLAAAFGTNVFLLLMSTMYNEGLLANAEHFVLLFAMPGIYLGLRSVQRGTIAGMLVSGLLIGIAILMKQHALFYGLFILTMIALAGIHRTHLLRTAGQAILLLAGLATPLCCLIWYLHIRHAYDSFYYLTVLYGSAYAAHSNTALQSLLNLLSRIADQYFLSLSIIAMIWMAWRPTRYRYVALLFFLLSFMAVCPGFIFRRHYFMLLFPAVGFLFATLLHTAGVYCAHRSRLQAYMSATVIAAFLAFFLPFNFGKSPDAVYHRHYPDQPFTLMHDAADYLKTVTHPGEKVGMFSNEPQLYYYAGVHAASPFLYNYPMLENHQYAAVMVDTFIHQIEAADPHVFIHSNANLMVYDSTMLDHLDHWWEQRRGRYTLTAVLSYSDEASKGTWYKGAMLTDTAWLRSARMEFYIRK